MLLEVTQNKLKGRPESRPLDLFSLSGSGPTLPAGIAPQRCCSRRVQPLPILAQGSDGAGGANRNDAALPCGFKLGVVLDNGLEERRDAQASSPFSFALASAERRMR